MSGAPGISVKNAQAMATKLQSELAKVRSERAVLSVKLVEVNNMCQLEKEAIARVTAHEAAARSLRDAADERLADIEATYFELDKHCEARISVARQRLSVANRKARLAKASANKTQALALTETSRLSELRAAREALEVEVAEAEEEVRRLVPEMVIFREERSTLQGDLVRLEDQRRSIVESIEELRKQHIQEAQDTWQAEGNADDHLASDTDIDNASSSGIIASRSNGQVTSPEQCRPLRMHRNRKRGRGGRGQQWGPVPAKVAKWGHDGYSWH